VFGFVPLTLTYPSGLKISSRSISKWLAKKMSCDEMAIGQVTLLDDSATVNIHSSKVSLALKAFEKYEFGGQKITASV